MIAIKTLASSSKGNCYYVTDGNTPLVLEAGINFREIRKALDFNTSNLAGCLITHEHGDHCKGLKDVLRAGIDCYASDGTWDALLLDGHHRGHPVKSHEPFTIGTWTIMPFDAQHDVSEPLGFLLANKAGDKLLFATDTYYIKYKFKNVSHMLIECNYSKEILDRNIEEGITPKVMRKRLLRSHFSLENVKEFLKANDLSRVQEIHLLHLSDSNSDEALFKREIQQLTGKVVYIA
ncbi:Phosphoribosyl 1,2-cyclic phosphodiesterase [Gracilibacillus orientalis]|uniref:Phosphoribosyl 1,2-cyclic phosphodiesterase n=1 Tax=Gracilibacillus orientalis TaxID=334253 RepID=A0A1I4PLV7_9BACI|nr:MBL fold metallo-hydrolase [Gracilibacillus orientalis]SFM28707.1 Phosphoribosyl 1,2-cyclic phosphodiesterase [Gracilibacillus orientalis]